MRTCPSCNKELDDTRFKYGYKDCKLCVSRRSLPRVLLNRRSSTAANPKQKHLLRIYNETQILIHKQCGTCNIILDVNNFSKSYKNKGDGYSNKCKACTKIHWHAKIDSRRTLYLLNRMRSNAKKLHVPFNLELSDIVIPTHCPILGVPLKFGRSTSDKRWRDDSPSVDRIVPVCGYVKGNIVVISYRANRIKNDSTLEELQAIADFYTTLTKKEINS